MPCGAIVRSRATALCALAVTLVLAACGEAATAPRAASDFDVQQSGAAETAGIRWNEVARALVARDAVLPPLASRAYACLSVAQYAAAVAIGGERGRDARAVQAAVIAASAEVLASLFPADADALREQARREVRALRGSGPSSQSLASAHGAGVSAAQHVIARARHDGSDATWTASVPAGAGFWFGTPQLPAWGQVTPWLMHSGSDFRSAPPPRFGGERFRLALAEVRQVSDTRSAEQLAIAREWADGPGTATPPGHWNQIAADLVRRDDLDELAAARVMALINVAIADATIACWDSKYTYWVIRPFQADPGITTPVGKPSHPSYPSGHACSSGAAATVLGYLFPSEARRMSELAEEASISRLYGGIHYRFDMTAGLRIGASVGGLAVELDRRGGTLTLAR